MARRRRYHRRACGEQQAEIARPPERTGGRAAIAQAARRGRGAWGLHSVPSPRAEARGCLEDRDMSIVLWIVFGLVVGIIAKLLTPGREPGGFVLTTLLGIGGALVGGLLGRAIGLYPSYQSTGGFFMSILGAVVILGIYNLTIGRTGRI
jgi:uncharacterized membrane protein YeaQ/YmgE (transglycosylase-associated protein family)